MRTLLIFVFAALASIASSPFRFAVAAVAVFADCLTSVRPARDHLALMPRAPRSIFDTRRMRLA